MLYVEVLTFSVLCYSSLEKEKTPRVGVTPSVAKTIAIVILGSLCIDVAAAVHKVDWDVWSYECTLRA